MSKIHCETGLTERRLMLMLKGLEKECSRSTKCMSDNAVECPPRRLAGLAGFAVERFVEANYTLEVRFQKSIL